MSVHARTKALTSWRRLNAVAMQLDEEQTLALLEEEKRDQRRVLYLLRLYSRYSMLRRERERDELVRLAADNPRATS